MASKKKQSIDGLQQELEALQRQRQELEEGLQQALAELQDGEHHVEDLSYAAAATGAEGDQQALSAAEDRLASTRARVRRLEAVERQVTPQPEGL